MKDLFKDMILDLPFDEDVQPIKIEKKKSKVILTEGETLIWKGEPNHSRSIFDKNYMPHFFLPRLFKYADFCGYFFVVTLAILIAGEDFIPVLIMASLIFPFLPIYHYLLFKKRKSTQYILTSKKLVFINWNLGFNRTDFIPLKNIKKLHSEEDWNYGSVGNIHFIFQNESILSSKAKDFIKNLTLSSPIFRNLKNVTQVVGFINKQKAKNKKV